MAANIETEAREIVQVHATVGKSNTIHDASAWTWTDEDGAHYQVFAIECGSDRYRNARSTFNRVASLRRTIETDCAKCLARRA